MMKVGAASETGELGPDGTRPVTPPPVQAPPPAEIARHFPQLEILECLGSGGMGAVYKARQPRLDRLVALKILTRDRQDESHEARFAERFEREARALARLNHPNIVAMYEFGQAGGRPYFIMEYVEGLSLRQVQQAGKLAPAEALRIVPQICEALQFAHDEGVVHRDIKPENILLDKKGRVKIADFGIAKILGRERPSSTLTEGQQVIGTPHYMAPEQVEHPQAVDHRADIYSLGVVFYELLTGELPLGKFAPPSRKVQVDVRLDDVVLRALEKEPERRYQRASEVQTDVQTIVSSSRPQETGSLVGPHKKDAPREPLKRIVVERIVASLFGLAGLADYFFAWMRGTDNLFRSALIGTVLIVVSLILFMVSQLLHLVSQSAPEVEPDHPERPEDAESHHRAPNLAAWGAAWALLFAVVWLWNYTPPGWVLTQGLRHVLGTRLIGLVMGSLTIVSFPAPIGVTVLGCLAVRNIRRTQGRSRERVSVLATALLFPLLLANIWFVWLWSGVAVSVSGASSELSTSILGIGVALILDAALVGWMWPRVWRPVPAPISPPSHKTAPTILEETAGNRGRRVVRRTAAVAVVQLILVESVHQASVTWRESTSELWWMALLSGTLAAMVWAAWPLFQERRKLWIPAGVAVALTAALYGVNFVYSMHLRPSLGLYREDNWVAEHPGFQWDWRQGMAERLWTTPVAPPFEPALEVVLPLDDVHPANLLDLDTGIQVARNGLDESSREARNQARAEKIDLAIVKRDGGITALGLGLGIGRVPHRLSWETLTSQQVMNFWLLDQTPAREMTKLPLPTSGTGLFVFRTREGSTGVLQFLGFSSEPAGLRMRCQRLIN